MIKSPFAKAIAAGILGAVVVAGVYFKNPYVIVAAAAAEPLAVYFQRNADAEG